MMKRIKKNKRKILKLKAIRLLIVMAYDFLHNLSLLFISIIIY